MRAAEEVVEPAAGLLGRVVLLEPYSADARILLAYSLIEQDRVRVCRGL